jgi:hypothetical protein
MKRIAWLGVALSIAGVGDAQPPDPLHALVRVVVRGTPIDGPTRAAGSSAAVVARGDRYTMAFSADESLCNRSLTEDPRAPFRADSAAAHRRVIEVVVMDLQTDRIQLDVSNERDEIGRTTRDVRRLTLAEGEPHLLDVIQAQNVTSSSACRQATITLEISASIVENAALEGETLTYDLWLTDRDQRGREQTRHLTRDGRQGEQVAYRFRSLRWPIADLAPAMSVPVDLDQSIVGSIRGRVRADGTVDVSLTTARDVAWLWSGAPGMGSTGDGGEKRFSARLGEAVRIDLPPTGGQSVATGPDGRQVWLYYPNIFNGHQMSLVVTVSRQ